MPTIIKRVGSILQNRKNVSFEELENILLYFGYTKSQRRRGSSHYTFRKKGMKPITVPKKRPHVNEHYVDNIIQLLGLEDWHEEHKNS